MVANSVPPPLSSSPSDAPHNQLSVGESAGGQQAREGFETARDSACVLELLTERERLGCLSSRLFQVSANDAKSGR